MSRPARPKALDARMSEVACTFCGKPRMPDAQVREGENPFHLDCYLLYKRRRVAKEAEAAQ